MRFSTAYALLNKNEIVVMPFFSKKVLCLAIVDHQKSWFPLPRIFLPGRESMNRISESDSSSDSAQDTSPGTMTVSSSLTRCDQAFFMRVM